MKKRYDGIAIEKVMIGLLKLIRKDKKKILTDRVTRLRPEPDSLPPTERVTEEKTTKAQHRRSMSRAPVEFLQRISTASTTDWTISPTCRSTFNPIDIPRSLPSIIHNKDLYFA